jgi:hypothetical protein
VIWSGFAFSNATAARVFMTVFLLVQKPVISKSAPLDASFEACGKNCLRKA